MMNFPREGVLRGHLNLDFWVWGSGGVSLGKAQVDQSEGGLY